MTDDYTIFETKNFALQAGGTLPSAGLAYATLGTLSPKGDNVVLIPSWYAGTHRESALCLTGAGRAIDPTPDAHQHSGHERREAVAVVDHQNEGAVHVQVGSTAHGGVWHSCFT